jgi:hypothetical protein
LGKYIRKFKKDKGISKVELSQTLRVNETTIMNWEIKSRVPVATLSFNPNFLIPIYSFPSKSSWSNFSMLLSVIVIPKYFPEVPH